MEPIAFSTMPNASPIPEHPAPVEPAGRLWYQDAIIYQLHVRAFLDSNGDGIGDFPGLTSKLDYIQDLGVTAIWLLPFFVSPLRDDGYDIADYTRVHPAYGTLEDFEVFRQEAHRRDLRVITEMVMNHTSDQHAWFQKSRHAAPGSRWRDFYVWSDTDTRYSDARVIFQDFETSNWTWDPVAQAYFWHRFYHHQPDLNYDNPEVHDAMFQILDFWLDRGVDGIRLDAVPYLYEREGTNCENLPETHAFLRKLRSHVDGKYADRMLLAEANQWPEDAAAYFGNGDECHINFHFPLMPRLFMAVEREDRLPILDILDQTPRIPSNCQWAIFLRNHDELTLEMVTDEERDYMYRVFALHPRAKVNLGIRRRLAPLLRDNRPKMELLNALLFTLPGTPILYYGDEIGMGDNIYLGDRDGVRTPMQWSDDRNAGFSRANPQQLYLPPVVDPLYHYASRNVEVEQRRPASLLWWTRRMIALRKQSGILGRGTTEFLTPDNPKILAYLRRDQADTMLIVANLSRRVQSVELDLSGFRGQIPVEVFGQTRFPPAGADPYFLTLGPHDFYWFRLESAQTGNEPAGRTLPSCRLSGAWDTLFRPPAVNTLESALSSFLKLQRWYAGKTRQLQQVTVLDATDLPRCAAPAAEPGEAIPLFQLLLVRAAYEEGEPEIYVLPLVWAQGARESRIAEERPGARILSVIRPEPALGVTLCDASGEGDFWQRLGEAIAADGTLPGRSGRIEASHTQILDGLRASLAPEISLFGGEQSNSSAVWGGGGGVILKLLRRVHRGQNPELEIGRYLTETARLACVPKLAGALTYRDREDEYTLAVLHEHLPGAVDGWTYTLQELDHFLERVEASPAIPAPASPLPSARRLLDLALQAPPPELRQSVGSYLQSAEILGARTAELHLALAAAADKDFAPEPFTKLYQRSIQQTLRSEARQTMALLRKHASQLAGEAAELAAGVLAKEPELLAHCQAISQAPVSARRTRCHGDFHLGQVLFTGRDFAIIDFEGEPDRPISERRIKTSPLRDVAGMLRSFHYAPHAARRAPAHASLIPSASSPDVRPWLSAWYLWSAASYLHAYLLVAAPGGFLPTDPDQIGTLLDAYLLQKALYEVRYELNNRPGWVAIPLEGILHLLQTQ